MKARKSMAFVVMLLLSAGVLAEGGKQRGDVGEGTIVQDQVRVVEPPAQWTSSSSSTSKETSSDQSALEELLDALTEELF